MCGNGPRVTSNKPLRGEKGTLYEGGIRVPLVASMPGRFREGAEIHTPVISTDILPTFLDLAGLTPPEDHPADGISVLPMLRGEEKTSSREALYWHYPAYHHSTPASAIRSGRYKLLEFFEDDRLELYDLEGDIGEGKDIAAEYPAVVRNLGSKLDRWRQNLDAGVPVSNPHYDPERAHAWGVRPQYPWEEAPREALEIRRVE